MSTVAFHTFGCKLNFSETSSISRMFGEKGYKRTTLNNKPDNLIINTCSVTENADKRCRELIRKIKRKSPKTKITVIGCYAQLKADKIIEIEGVDKVLGTKEKFSLENYINTSKKVIHSNIKESRDFHSTYSIDDRTRSFLKIQDGCNYGCSFCTIPLARGRSRSSDLKDVIININSLINDGTKEIVLSGINIGDYGIIDGKRKSSFYSLLKEIEKIKCDVRIRISSIEPNLLSNEIIKLVHNSNKFVNHFHIPLQSGNNRILKKMSRRYNRELYIDRVKMIRSLMPSACIGGDVIVGFPGETDNDFLDTYNFIKKLEINYLHVFPYSERSNTKANKLSDIVPTNIRNERSKMLRSLSDKKKRMFYEKNLLSKKNVLFEKGENKENLFGYTENYVRVKIKYDKKIIGKVIKTSLERIDSEMNVVGKII